MACRYGCGPRGKRLIMQVPHAYWKTSALVAGLRLEGLRRPAGDQPSDKHRHLPRLG